MFFLIDLIDIKHLQFTLYLATLVTQSLQVEQGSKMVGREGHKSIQDEALRWCAVSADH